MGYPKDRTRPLFNIHGYAKVFGGSLPAMIWARYMRFAHQGLPVVSFPKPPAVVPITVPDVTGKPFDDAKGELEAAGFTVRKETVSSSLAPGVVAQQDPPGGTQTDPGAMITLFVSDGTGSGEPPPQPEPTDTPSP